MFCGLFIDIQKTILTQNDFDQGFMISNYKGKIIVK